jgi:hypothetical protein
MGRIPVFLSFFFLVGFSMLTTPQSTRSEDLVEQDVLLCFDWALVALKDNDGKTDPVAIKADTRLKTGDRFKMLIRMKKEGFAYVLLHDSRGDLTLLFPYDAGQFRKDWPRCEECFIPQGTAWFELDEHKGRETIYLLASIRRLTSLETLLCELQEADAGNRPEMVDKILSEIRELRWKNRQFKALAERPMSIIGSQRGLQKEEERLLRDLNPFAMEISSPQFYGKTFTIEHE